VTLVSREAVSQMESWGLGHCSLRGLVRNALDAVAASRSELGLKKEGERRGR